MTVAHAFAGLAVANYADAYDWYVRLLGRPADMFPHEREAVWHLTPNGSIYVVEDTERAGRGLVALALDDLDAQESRLRDAGVAYTEEGEATAPRRLVVRDVDGNTVTFFQDPQPSPA
jgi:catechol 2,3-dioxygenase-like lactoylglutathione lyase family enzyme